MPAKLQSTYIHLFTNTVIFGVYAWCVFGILGIDYFTGAEALTRIGKTISITIVAGYAFEIMVVLCGLISPTD